MSGLLGRRLASNSLLILDGAMGTELQRRGVDIGLPLWSANALMSHPDVVLQIHKDYLTAGADIITTNTFRTTQRAFRNANLPDRSFQLTSTAVALAMQARESFPDALIAGSIAPLEDCYRPDLVLSDANMEEEHAELAIRLAERGVDFILLETMNTIREAQAACRAATATGKEVVVSFVCDKGGRLLSGESLADAVTVIEKLNPTALSINCVSPRYIHIAFEELKKVTGLPLMLYANIGSPDDDKSSLHFTRDVTKEEYVAYAVEWQRRGASIIGGCCGTTPEYIRAVVNGLEVVRGTSST